MYHLNLFTYDPVQVNGVFYELLIIHMIFNLFKHEELLHMLKKSRIGLEIKEEEKNNNNNKLLVSGQFKKC